MQDIINPITVSRDEWSKAREDGTRAVFVTFCPQTLIHEKLQIAKQLDRHGIGLTYRTQLAKNHGFRAM